MVKNESPIIERCLGSLLNIIDSVIITDTGSEDDTAIKAGMFLQRHGIPYNIYYEPFKDFGHNRTKLLELAKNNPSEYILMIDVDEVLEAPNFNKNNLTYGYYNLLITTGNTSYYLPRLTRNHLNFKYIGVTHEFLDTQNMWGENLANIQIKQINDSYRRISNNKFLDDIKLLEKELQNNNLNNILKSRYIFYLAQSYQNIGDYTNAAKYYIERTRLGEWEEEIFYSYYQLGKINKDINSLVKAHEIRPDRNESLIILNKIINSRINNNLKLPTGLFIENDKYGTNTISTT